MFFPRVTERSLLYFGARCGSSLLRCVHTRRCVFGIYWDGLEVRPGKIGASHMEVVISCRWSIGGSHRCSGMRTIFLTVRAVFWCLAALCCCCVGATLTFAYLLDRRCCVSNSLAEPCYRVYYVGRVLLYINNPKPPSFKFQCPLLLSRVSFEDKASVTFKFLLPPFHGSGRWVTRSSRKQKTTCQDASDLAPRLS
jgi:hypothetical protein